MKIGKGKKRFWPFAIIGVAVGTMVAVALYFLCRIDYTLSNELVFEINSEVKVSDLFDTMAGNLENGEEKVDTSNLGVNVKTVKIGGLFGIQKSVDINYEVVDLVAPVIEGEDNFSVFKNDGLNITEHYEIHDDSMDEVEINTIGECDTTIVGECSLKIIVKDKSGNEASRDVTASVVRDPEVESWGRNEYFVRVNREQNVVMVYALDRSGEYNKLAKVFVSSVGKVGSETPLGTFRVSDRYEALYLVGNVWGHYATRIRGPYFFHSVPYFTKGNPAWDNLEYLEYNKLGEGASAGCVRLAVKDAKWVFDNVPAGTMVEIYVPEGVVKPEAIRIDEDSEYRGWDPTDPDSSNPWNQ